MARANRHHNINDPLTRRNVTISESVQTKMRQFTASHGINWSTVIDAYLKIYIWELEQKERK